MSDPAPAGSSSKPPGDSLNRTVSLSSSQAGETGVTPSASEGGALPSLPNYEVLEKLGEGGMGAVYRARQLALDRPVAIKVLPERLSKNSHYVARLNREARVLAKLNHTNVIACYDLGEHQGMRYVVMEFVEGENLGKLIERRGSLPEKEALHYLKQAVVGLDHAHAVGIIHRDIKPENMLLARATAVNSTIRVQAGHTLKIADLGLATFTGESVEDTRLTAAGSSLGSPHYMSPEQTMGEDDLDLRTDVYALGVTLFQMLTGQTPYSGPTVGAVLARKLSEKIRDPRSIKPELAPQLSLLIQKMTARSKGDRYASYGELLEDIEACEQRRALKARPLPDDRAGLVLLPETLAALNLETAQNAAATATLIAQPRTSERPVTAAASASPVPQRAEPPKSGAMVAVGALAVLGVMAFAGMYFSRGSASPAPNPGPIATPTPPTSPTPPTPPTPPAQPKPAQTFDMINLVNNDLYEHQWANLAPAPGKFLVNEDGIFALEAQDGWAKAEYPLPATSYSLGATLQTPRDIDAIEVQSGFSDTEYIAFGLRLKAGEKMTAYVEQRKIADNSLVKEIGKRSGLDPDKKQSFQINVKLPSITCSLNNAPLAAITLDDKPLKPILRIAVKNGTGWFESLELSPAAGSK